MLLYRVQQLSMEETIGNSTVDLPPDSLVNFNFAITVILSFFAPPLHGMVLLPVLLLKRLRRQPHQYLYSNYLSSSLAIVLGFGFYRGIQVGRYLLYGYEVGVKKTACNIMKFFSFPLTASNLCLFLLGFERFFVLQYNKTIDWLTLPLLIALPWALGIFRHAFQLSSESYYKNIPYIGICVDVTKEKKGRTLTKFLLDFAIPFLLASITIFMTYIKSYCKWKKIKMKQKNGLHNLSSNELTRLQQEQRSIIKITKTINLAAAFFILQFFTMLIFQVLHSKVEDDNSPQEMRDRAGVVAMFFLLFDVTINPILFFIFNSKLRKAVCDKIPMLMKIPLIYPDNDDDDDDDDDNDNDEERVTENETIEMKDIYEPN